MPQTSAAPPRKPLRSFIARWFRRLTIAVAYAYPICLIVLTLLFYYVGENWWVTSVGLFIPRYLFAIPLPFIVVALLLSSQRRLLRTQLAAALVVLVPLMGFVFPWPTLRSDGPALRVLSFNVDSGRAGYDKLIAAVVSHAPDVVLIQEAEFGDDEAKEALRRHFPHVKGSTQFVVASRFPILSTREPERLPYHGELRSPRFTQYVLETPLGPLAFYNVHPLSPRGMLNIYRLRAVPHELRSGRLLSSEAESDVQGNARLRALQIETMARLAARETHPVVIAGDLNLPGLSSAFRENLSSYQDGFRAASWGFGYTFSGKYMLLRLDRILASPELEFVGFEVGCKGLSDHLCVIADLQRR